MHTTLNTMKRFHLHPGLSTLSARSSYIMHAYPTMSGRPAEVVCLMHEAGQPPAFPR